MALIPCFECGHSISQLAKSCTKCGAPQNHWLNKQTLKHKLSLLKQLPDDDDWYQNEKISSMAIVGDLLTELETLEKKQSIFNFIFGITSLTASMLTLMIFIIFGTDLTSEGAESLMDVTIVVWFLAIIIHLFSNDHKIKKLKNKIKFERKWIAEHKDKR